MALVQSTTSPPLIHRERLPRITVKQNSIHHEPHPLQSNPTSHTSPLTVSSCSSCRFRRSIRPSSDAYFGAAAAPAAAAAPSPTGCCWMLLLLAASLPPTAPSSSNPPPRARPSASYACICCRSCRTVSGDGLGVGGVEDVLLLVGAGGSQDWGRWWWW